MTLNPKDLQEKLERDRREAEEADARRRAAKNLTPYLSLISTTVPTEIEAMALVPEERAKEALLVPLQLVRKKLKVAVFDPTLKKTKEVLDELRAKNYELILYTSSLSGLKHIWEYYEYVGTQKEISGRVEIDQENLSSLAKEIKTFEDLAKKILSFDKPRVSELLEIMLAGALSLGASDIHLEPEKKRSVVRLRVDGVLHEIEKNFPISKYRSVVNRIKLLSNLKLNVKEEPQDGRFTIALKNKNIEVRTSIIPSEYGEMAVLRVLDPESLKTDLSELGLRDDDFLILKKEIERPNGLILNTGPTGSGKTTTLYAILKKLSNPGVKIITIEDPIEYHLEGISQTQVRPEAKYTFASGLRSILRQDPDVILVGEIRDKETAEIAMNASLTGHLVLSTIHANDAAGTLPRLIDLGANVQIIGPALNLIMAQRLVRVVCRRCKKETALSGAVRKKINEFVAGLPGRIDKTDLKNPRVYEAAGCKECAGTGYKGRISLFELLLVTKEVEGAIYKNPNEIEIKDLARRQEMVTMQEDGVLKVLLGKTSFEEVERLTGKIEWLH